MVAADDRTAVTFSLSPGQAGDAPEGRELLKTLKNKGWEGTQVLMDKAYEGDETRQLVFDLGMEPVVPPKKNRISPWGYDREVYKKRNDVERLFRRLKGFRRIFSRFDKLDVVFTFFIQFALIIDTLISVNRPWQNASVWNSLKSEFQVGKRSNLGVLRPKIRKTGAVWKLRSVSQLFQSSLS